MGSCSASLAASVELRRPNRVGKALLLTVCMLLAASLPAARAQESPAGADPAVTTSSAAAPKHAPAQDVAVEGMGSFGHYRIFAGGEDAKMYTGGMEYDRNSWGPFLRARTDYVAEFLPVMRLNESADTDVWGDRLGPGRRILYGIGLSPIGIRFVWGKGYVRPFFTVKAGVVVWNHKFISDQASYIQFSLQESVGTLVKLTDRYDLRLGFIGDFHESNGFMTDVNPGLDVMNYQAGLVYHLGYRRRRVP